jgi:hypothetical protein
MKSAYITLFVAFALLPTMLLAESTSKPSIRCTLIHLSSGELIGLAGVTRVVNEGKTIRVTLTSGANLDLGDAGDVQTVQNAIQELDQSGVVALFEPSPGVRINLLQTNQIRLTSDGLYFWGLDGQAFRVKVEDQPAEVLSRVKEFFTIAKGLEFVEVIPGMFINCRHVQHVAIVDGKLRIMTSNKTWPLIADADQDSAMKKLKDAAKNAN